MATQESFSVAAVRHNPCCQTGMNTTPSPMFTGPLVDLLQSVRWQFDETPDAVLTVADAERIWPIGPDRLVVLFETFVDVGYLQRVDHGAYRRRPDEI